MTTMPEPLHQTVTAIFDAWEASAGDGLRDHSGASIAGHDCARFIWNDFRWIERGRWPGRMLRLFDHGKLEEARVEADLKRIKCTVSTADERGNQWRVSAHGGHFGGSMDGVVVGLHEAPRTWHVLEIKTANEKSWQELSKKGVKAAQYRHWCQMQIYMLLGELKRACYISVNKNSDDIYLERIEIDKEAAQKLVDRVGMIIFSSEPPPRISEDADWWQCRNCTYRDNCHGTDAPLVNCRTCAHSTPESVEGMPIWRCEISDCGGELMTADPRKGCPSHRYIPALLEKFAEPVDASGNAVEYRNKLTGATFSNGELSSAEIRACTDKKMLGQERVDPNLKQLREEFGGVYG